MPTITKREPRLAPQHHEAAQTRRLSARQVGEVLNQLPPEAVAMPALAAALHSAEFYTRLMAARLLAKRGDAEAFRIFEDGLNSPFIPTRASCARHLYGFGWEQAAPLLERALADDEARVREGAVYALCAMQTPTAYARLMAALEQETDDTVLEAVAMPWGLENRHAAEAVQALELALKTRVPDIRARIAETLSTTEHPAAVPVLARLILLDTDPHVVYNAALSYIEVTELANLANFAAIITQMLPNGNRLAAALRGFFHVTNYLHLDIAHHPATDTLLEALQGALSHPDAAVRMQAVWIPAWMPAPRAHQLVLDAYHAETDSEVRAHIRDIARNLMMPGAETIQAG